jgi:hypothetical protein
MALFTNYDDWRSAITGVCRLELTRSYCAERRKALADESDPATRDFVKAYGPDYRDRVLSWFGQAGEEAVE